MKRVFIFALILTFLFSAECFAEFNEITFGRYFQSATSQELSPIEWLVLEDNGDELLLITKKCIDEIPYNERRTNVTWESCTLRKWLNDQFISTAFTNDEKGSIIPAVLSDKVFMLDRNEVIKYMPNETDRQCEPTDYAQSRGTYTNESGLCAWWTRSPGQNNSQAVYLSSYGSFGRRPHYVNDNVIGVRPVIRIRKNFAASELDIIEAEKYLHSVKPDSQKAYEVETRLQPMMKQEAPFNVKELYDYFLRNPQKALQEFDRKRIEVQGVVLNKGPDRAFGQPSIELSDMPGGKCYVLCVFQNANSYRTIKTGDKISVRGNYLVVHDGYGIVLKICELI